MTALTARFTASTDPLAARADEEIPEMLTEICSDAEEIPLTFMLTSSAAPAIDWMVLFSCSAPVATDPA